MMIKINSLDLTLDWEPAMHPPPGIATNYVNPPSCAEPVKVINLLFPTLAFIMMAIRIYSRTKDRLGQGFGWDDGFCILAVAGSIANTVLIHMGFDYGLGRHLWDIPAIVLSPKVILLITIASTMNILTLFAVKTSILIQYFRIFGIYPTSRKLIQIGFAMNILITFSWMAVGLARVFTCKDSSQLVDGFCTSRTLSTTLLTFTTVNSVSDYYILAIPVVRVLKLQLDKKRKFGLLAVFMSGLIACLMSSVRIVFVAITFGDSDIAWNLARTAPYTFVELNLAIICSCMMFVPGAMKRYKIHKEKSSMKSSLVKSSSAETLKSGSQATKMKSLNSTGKDSVAATDMELGRFDNSWERPVPSAAHVRN